MRGRRIRVFMLLCALAAMGLRIAAPPGYMFGANADGRIVVTLCGGAVATIDLGKSDHHRRPQTETPCGFAALAHAAPAPADQVALLASYTAQPTSAVAPARVGQGLAAPPPPATGPPFQA